MMCRWLINVRLFSFEKWKGIAYIQGYSCPVSTSQKRILVRHDSGIILQYSLTIDPLPYNKLLMSRLLSKLYIYIKKTTRKYLLVCALTEKQTILMIDDSIYKI